MEESKYHRRQAAHPVNFAQKRNKVSNQDMEDFSHLRYPPQSIQLVPSNVDFIFISDVHRARSISQECAVDSHDPVEEGLFVSY